MIHDPCNNLAWNLFNVILQGADELRHNRFVIRLQQRLLNTEGVRLIDANYRLSVGNSSFALKFFMKEFRKRRTPYFSFVLGVILLQIYCQRLNKDKKMLAEIVTYLFIYYATNRSQTAQHEVDYNMGRMYQQLGVMYLAEHYYLKVLKFDSELVDKHSNILSLKYEAAYNLHVIYRNSGNLIAARNVLIKHVVI